MSMEQGAVDVMTPELDRALILLEAELATVGDREVVILSDFDYTLCDEYVFDPQTNNHLAVIEPGVVEAAKPHHMVVATSRRATNPTVSLLWQSGLVQPNRPAIIENGGAIISQNAGSLACLDLVDPGQLEQLHAMPELAAEAMPDIPSGQELIFKMGRTMLVARLQDEAGISLPHHQRWLAEQLRDIVPSSSPLQVVDTRASVTIQHRDVNKGTAFLKYLELEDIPRDSIYVIGLGDGENDAEIFDEADLSLGFSDAVSSIVDIDIPHGPRAIPHVLGIIQSASRSIKAVDSNVII
jgi:hydroxymethylpyrimidine pyrophosphatase-like HAD family hydrolase